MLEKLSRYDKNEKGMFYFLTCNLLSIVFLCINLYKDVKINNCLQYYYYNCICITYNPQHFFLQILSLALYKGGAYL